MNLVPPPQGEEFAASRGFTQNLLRMPAGLPGAGPSGRGRPSLWERARAGSRQDQLIFARRSSQSNPFLRFVLPGPPTSPHPVRNRRSRSGRRRRHIGGSRQGVRGKLSRLQGVCRQGDLASSPRWRTRAGNTIPWQQRRYPAVKGEIATSPRVSPSGRLSAADLLWQRRLISGEAGPVPLQFVRRLLADGEVVLIEVGEQPREQVGHDNESGWARQALPASDRLGAACVSRCGRGCERGGGDELP
jgi:hypothetical protein